MADRIFIVGLGSAGARHARNALALGCEVIGYDPRFSGIGQWSRDLPPITAVTQLEVGLAQHPLGVIVATPPETHLYVASQVIRAGIPVLIEKPLATSADAAYEFIRDIVPHYNGKVMVGYQLRHTPQLQQLRSVIMAGMFGGVHAQVLLATRAWCSGTYRADLLLECSHELDAIRFLFGNPLRVRTMDCVGLLVTAEFECECVARITLYIDGEAEGYRRNIRVGDLYWEFSPVENQEAYIAELQDFLAVCRGEKQPGCSGNDGWWALRMVEAIRKSGQTGRWESV